MSQKISIIVIMKLVVSIIYLLSASLAGATPPMPKTKPSSSTVLTSSQKVFKTASTHFDRVVYIVFENQQYKEVVLNSTFKELMKKGTSFTQFFGETHPSQPNYIAMIAGDTLGVQTDSNVSLDGKHLGDLLEDKGMNWSVYAEDYPGHCFLEESRGYYARKHVPFLSFKNVEQNKARCSNVKNLLEFDKDWKAHQLPTFSMIIPNNFNNGHDTDIKTTANWINQYLKRYIDDQNFLKQTLVVLTYDEDDYQSTNQVFTLLLGSAVKGDYLNHEKHNHYSLLKLMEEEWQLGSLNRNDKMAAPISNLWK